MKNQFHAETAKLSLVGKHSHAINFSQVKDDNQDIEYIAARLPAVLQTSLELDDVIELFHKEINKILIEFLSVNFFKIILTLLLFTKGKIRHEYFNKGGIVVF